MKELRCHGGQHRVPHKHAMDQHCSKECREADEFARRAVIEALEENQFTQSKLAPNMYERAGYHVTIEECLANGILEVVRRSRS